MRIMFVVNSLTYGGAETQLILVSRELARRGHSVLIHTLRADNPRAVDLDGSGVIVIQGEKRHKLDLTLIRRIRQVIREFQPDIVQGWLIDGNLNARLAAAGTDVPVLDSERNDNYVFPLQHRIANILTRRLVAGVVANTHAGARFAQRRLATAHADTHVVWNGIDVDEITARATEDIDLGERYFGIPHAKVACVIAMLRPEKDHALALRVADLMVAMDPAWRLLIVGDALPQTAAYKEALLDRASALTRRGIVAFAGLQKNPAGIIRAAKVLLSTSLHEGFPNVVLEAMAVGTPVVSTEYSDIRQILPVAGQVVGSRDAQELATAVLRADRRRQFIAGAQKAWLDANATIDVAARRLEAVYANYLPAVTAAEWRRQTVASR